MTKTILLTGANRGLGEATAIELARQGHRLLLTARTAAKAQAAVAAVAAVAAESGAPPPEGLVVEMTSFASIRRLGAELRARAEADATLRLDLLHHNAGMLLPPEQRTLSEDGVELTLQVNTLAPLLLSHELTPLMASPARITATGSTLHLPGSRGAPVDFRFDDPMLNARYVGERAYKNSKLALLWIMTELDRRAAARGLRCDVISPGFVPTTAAENVRGLSRFFLRHVLSHMPFATSVDDSASNMARLLGTDALDPGGGRYFVRWVEASASPDARDPEKARRFWTMACEWTGLSEDWAEASP